MFWLALTLGFILGIAFSIAWVFFEFALECAKLAGRKWSWRHGFSKHASVLELEKEERERNARQTKA